MTPQSEFLILARVRPDALADLRALLATMNARPGHADPANPLVPFGAFPTLHLARFVVLEDQTLADNAAFGVQLFEAPVYLAFLGDCDGPAEPLLEAMARTASAGLSRIFNHCEDFAPDTDGGANVGAWMAARRVAPSAYYVNTGGRTVAQIRDEASLHAALAAELPRACADGGASPGAVQARLREARAANGPRLRP